MRLFNLVEFGVGRPFVWRPVVARCVVGCLCFEFGHFFLTILRGDCRD